MNTKTSQKVTKETKDRSAKVKPVILHFFAAAFTEWERRYREEPERFQSEAEKLLKETPKTYGEACAPYFLQILSGG